MIFTKFCIPKDCLVKVVSVKHKGRFGFLSAIYRIKQDYITRENMLVFNIIHLAN